MALTDNPYLQLYVKDWMTSNKLKLCSAKAHGILINILCVLHRENEYGKILLRQKFKQSDNMVLNFAKQFAKFLPFDAHEIFEGLEELIEEEVLIITDDSLVSEKLQNLADISKKRASAGKKGGKKTISKNKNFAQAKHQANSEIDIGIENDNEIENKNGIDIKKKESQKNELLLPFDSENFKSQWNQWKTYKESEFSFCYKSIQSEQAALMELSSLSGGSESTAIAIIHQSMAKGWKGFFELKTTNNGSKNNQNSNANSNLSVRANQAVDAFFGK